MLDPDNNAADLARPSTSKSRFTDGMRVLAGDPNKPGDDWKPAIVAIVFSNSVAVRFDGDRFLRTLSYGYVQPLVETGITLMPDRHPNDVNFEVFAEASKAPPTNDEICAPPADAEHYSLHKLQLRADPEAVRSFRFALGKWVVASENGRSEMRTFEEMGDAWRYVGPDTDGADEAEAKPAPLGCRPPAEFEGERWHWVHDGIVLVPLEWEQKFGCWATGVQEGMRVLIFPTDEPALHWTWHSVALPTPKVEPAPTAEPPTRCEPSDEFNGHILHWVINSRLGQVTQMAAAWSGYGERWSFYGRNDDKTPEQMAEEGWTYDRPVVYPTAVESTPTLSQALLPCPICGGVEGCDHTVPERLQATLDKMVPTVEPTDAAIDAFLKAISPIGMTPQGFAKMVRACLTHFHPQTHVEPTDAAIREHIIAFGWDPLDELVRMVRKAIVQFRPQTHYVSDADKSLMRRVMTGAGCAHVWHRVKKALGE